MAYAHLYVQSPGEPLQRCECQGGGVNDPQWRDPTLKMENDRMIGMEMFTLQETNYLPSLKLNRKFAPESWMLGIRSFLLGRGMAYFQGRTVSFMECNMPETGKSTLEVPAGFRVSWDSYLEGIVLILGFTYILCLFLAWMGRWIRWLFIFWCWCVTLEKEQL